MCGKHSRAFERKACSAGVSWWAKGTAGGVVCLRGGAVSHKSKNGRQCCHMFTSQRNHIHNIKTRGRLQENKHKQLRESMRATAYARCSFLHLTKTHPNLLRWSPTAARCDTGKIHAANYCEATLETMRVANYCEATLETMRVANYCEATLETMRVQDAACREMQENKLNGYERMAKRDA